MLPSRESVRLIESPVHEHQRIADMKEWRCGRTALAGSRLIFAISGQRGEPKRVAQITNIMAGEAPSIRIGSSAWSFLGGEAKGDVKTASTARRLIQPMDAVAAARFFSLPMRRWFLTASSQARRSCSRSRRQQRSVSTESSTSPATLSSRRNT
jgi:hypothetical protein